MGLYDYKKVYTEFSTILAENKQRAMLKKVEYLEKIMNIFRQFVNKCQKEIDSIIDSKINQLSLNFEKMSEYTLNHKHILTEEQNNLLVSEFLIKPFQRFPFSGNKNEKLFKQQYNLIQKASVLIEQTLVDSFNEDEIPTFNNKRFFETLTNHGIGSQSLTKLRINPQNFSIKPLYDVQPLQKSVKSLKIIKDSIAVLVGDSRVVQFWDMSRKICIKKFHAEIMAEISVVTVFKANLDYLVLGFKDQKPQILSYRMSDWKRHACNVSHNRQITRLVQYEKWLISGSLDGSVCINQFSNFKTLHQSPHISSVEDIILKNDLMYVLLKCSTVCEYELKKQPQPQQLNMQFRRTLSAGYIEIIRFPEVTSNFMGVACHIYGLSQIEITRKFKIEETNIINVVEMISDFIIVESKETSQFFAVCCFQNSTAIRIYSLLSQDMVYELPSDYTGEVGVGNYLPKIEIAHSPSGYLLMLVVQPQFAEESNLIKVYEFKC